MKSNLKAIRENKSIPSRSGKETAVVACLEIVEGSSRDVVIKFPHHVPWPISNPN